MAAPACPEQHACRYHFSGNLRYHFYGLAVSFLRQGWYIAAVISTELARHDERQQRQRQDGHRVELDARHEHLQRHHEDRRMSANIPRLLRLGKQLLVISLDNYPIMGVQ